MTLMHLKFDTFEQQCILNHMLNNTNLTKKLTPTMRYTSKNSISISVEFARILLSKVTLEEPVIDDLLRNCRIPKHLLQEPNARISLVQYAELLKELARETQDELIGHGTSPLPYGSMSLLVHWMLAAKNLKQSGSRLTRFFKILGQGLAIRSYTEGDLVFFEMERPTYNQHADTFVAELCLSNIHRLLSWLTQEIIAIDHVDFQWPTPEYAQDYQLMFYGAPVYFNQDKNRIALPLSIFEKNIQQNQSNLDKFLENPSFEILVMDFKSDNLASKIAARIRQTLDATPAFPELAKDMGLQPYTLRRYLAKEGLSYLAIKNQVKRDAAIDMLVSTDLSIEEISSQLGFSETSPFTRTFKEWTGIPPSAYRKYH